MDAPAHQAGQEHDQPDRQPAQPTMRLPRLRALDDEPIPRFLLESFGIPLPDSHSEEEDEDLPQDYEDLQQGELDGDHCLKAMSTICMHKV